MWKSHTLKKTAVEKVGNVFNPGFILKTTPICQIFQTHPFFSCVFQSHFDFSNIPCQCGMLGGFFSELSTKKSIKNLSKQCWHLKQAETDFIAQFVALWATNWDQVWELWNEIMLEMSYLSVIVSAWSSARLAQQRRSSPSMENPTKHTHTHTQQSTSPLVRRTPGSPSHRFRDHTQKRAEERRRFCTDTIVRRRFWLINMPPPPYERTHQRKIVTQQVDNTENPHSLHPFLLIYLPTCFV